MNLRPNQLANDTRDNRSNLNPLSASNSGNPTPLTLGALAYLLLFIPFVALGRWVESRFAWKR